MTDAAMKEWTDRWYANHPRVGTSSHAAAAATFTVQDFRFDNDGNAATQVDTAHITVGQTVLWQWIIGSHTITSGTGSLDPQVGVLFDQPSTMTSQQFSFTFNTAGTFPFFCRPHEGFNMKGAVDVKPTAGVEPGLGGGRALGFTAPPSPNPTRRGVNFQFALRQAGRARAEVFEARGRLVAVILDRDLDAGLHSASWDGRNGAGALAGPGTYYLRLRQPGLVDTRRIVITR